MTSIRQHARFVDRSAHDSRRFFRYRIRTLDPTNRSTDDDRKFFWAIYGKSKRKASHRPPSSSSSLVAYRRTSKTSKRAKSKKRGNRHPQSSHGNGAPLGSLSGLLRHGRGMCNWIHRVRAKGLSNIPLRPISGAGLELASLVTRCNRTQKQPRILVGKF